MKNDNSMKRQKISDTISNLNEEIITEAALYQPKQNSNHYHILRWAAIAASLLLVLACSLPILNNLIKGPDKYATDRIMTIEYDNAIYEIIIDNKEALDKFGIEPLIILTTDPPKIPFAGNHIAYLTSRNNSTDSTDFVVTNSKTDMELLEYKPANNKAHLVYRNGDNYYIIRFCNYISPDDVSYPVNEALKIYGIYTSEDIKSITPTSTDNTWAPTGDAVTDSEKIKEFYDDIINLKHYSFEEYHELAFGEALKDADDIDGGDIGGEIYTKHADDLHVLVLETKEGIRFTIEYYPSFKWIKFKETDSYCKITPALSEWLQENVVIQ